MSYLEKGQFRYVEYTDDGCSIWQCLWCRNTIEIRDNPEWARWCFCPKCGRSWFKKMECRDHWVPRWYYDRWGNGNDPDAPDPDFMSCRGMEKPTKRWVIERRTKWFNNPWGRWEYMWSIDKDPYRSDYQKAYSSLQYHKDRPGSDATQREYRVRLKKI